MIIHAWENGETIELTEEEKQGYINYVKEKNPGMEIEYIKIKFDGDFADVEYKVNPVPFERIRRITGYLTGTTDTWNNAKQAELKDRVKHGGCSCCNGEW